MHDGEDLTVKVGKSDFFESIHVILGMLAENFQRFDGGNEIDRRTISCCRCCFPKRKKKENNNGRFLQSIIFILNALSLEFPTFTIFSLPK